MSDEKRTDPASWGDGYRAGYADAVRDATDHLRMVADWCERHGFQARARATRSSMQRVDDLAVPKEEPAGGEETGR